jgi:hypothetical protein
VREHGVEMSLREMERLECCHDVGCHTDDCNRRSGAKRLADVTEALLAPQVFVDVRPCNMQPPLWLLDLPSSLR